jgi:hypothetical protein
MPPEPKKTLTPAPTAVSTTAKLKPVRRIEFNSPIELLPGSFTGTADCDQQLRTPHGFKPCPRMLYDFANRWFIVGTGDNEHQIPLDSGKVNQFWFAKAAKGS